MHARPLLSAAKWGQLPTEQNVNVKWRAEEKSWVWVRCTDGAFLGIWRVIHTKLCIVLARPTSVMHNLAKGNVFLRISCPWEYSSVPMILKCFTYKVFDQIFIHRTDWWNKSEWRHHLLTNYNGILWHFQSNNYVAL